MTPEGRIKAKLKRELDKLPNVYRFMPVQNGMGAPALDFYLCVHGHFVAIETKAPGKKMTARQEVTSDQILKAWGRVFVVSTPEEVNELILALKPLGAANASGEEV